MHENQRGVPSSHQRVSRLVVGMLVVALLLVGAIWPGLPQAHAAPLSTSSCQEGDVPVPTNGLLLHIYGELCNPLGGPTQTLLVLVAGLGYSHLYWDWPVINGVDYSAMRYLSGLGFAHPGVAAYSTFAFDRIGIGQSSRPPGTLVTLQSNVAVLHQLIARFRAGDLGFGRFHAFSRIVLVGHSFGSTISEQEAATYHDEDGVILTGELHKRNAQIATMSKKIVARDDPSHRFLSLDPGYLTTAPGSFANLYYASMTADPAVIRSNESVKETLTQSEYASLALASASKVTLEIRVPVLLVVGQLDAIHCMHAVNCQSAERISEEEAPYFSQDAHVQIVIIPGTGHDLNLHTTCAATYASILSWTQSHVAP